MTVPAPRSLRTACASSRPSLCSGTGARFGWTIRASTGRSVGAENRAQANGHTDCPTLAVHDPVAPVSLLVNRTGAGWSSPSQLPQGQGKRFGAEAVHREDRYLSRGLVSPQPPPTGFPRRNPGRRVRRLRPWPFAIVDRTRMPARLAGPMRGHRRGVAWS